MASLYGCEMLTRGNLVLARLYWNFVAVKLILAALVFFKFDYVHYNGDDPPTIVDDLKAVLDIQDQYSDLIWRYLLYRYDHTYAVRCFSRLVLSLLALILALVHPVQGSITTRSLIQLSKIQNRSLFD